MTLKEFQNNFLTTLSPFYPKEEIDSFFYLLIDFRLQLKRVDIALNPTQKIATDSIFFFSDALERLKKEIPIQYIIGTTEFFGLPFYVDKNVLIPRPETEELVRWAIDEANKKKSQTPNHKPQTILDIGTGSGCIAVSLAKNLPNTEIWALDISEEALKIAQKNAELNAVNITFVNEDILTSTRFDSLRLTSTRFDSLRLRSATNVQRPKSAQQFDIIVSNPPYVRMQEKQEIKNNVLKNEPHLALFIADNNPLLFYDRIADFAIKNLTENGILFFEINQYLAKETVALLKNKGFKNIELRTDIFGNDRMIKACF